jgi:hypothetical protein
MSRRMTFFFLIAVWMVVGSAASGQEECGIPPTVTSNVSPNVLIVFDTSGSMWSIVWDQHFNSALQYHEVGRDGNPNSLLPIEGDQIVFARDGSCLPDHNYVIRNSSTGRTRLRFARVRSGSTDICNSSNGNVESDTDGFFYFDRAQRRFIDAIEYDRGGPPVGYSGIRLWQPHRGRGRSGETIPIDPYSRGKRGHKGCGSENWRGPVRRDAVQWEFRGGTDRSDRG